MSSEMRRLNEILDELSPEARSRVEARATEIVQSLEEVGINYLRKIPNLTQADVAAKQGVSQAQISKLESQDDMKISTLRQLIMTLGGTLDLVACFDTKCYRIKNPSNGSAATTT